LDSWKFSPDNSIPSGCVQQDALPFYSSSEASCRYNLAASEEGWRHWIHRLTIQFRLRTKETPFRAGGDDLQANCQAAWPPVSSWFLPLFYNWIARRRLF
jgi:hypothetical protein